MVAHTCPRCHSGKAYPPRRLDIESDFVNYYRCAACGHLWTVNKNTGHTHHVTALNERQAQEPSRHAS